jgi:hypothetical protein
VCSYMVLNVANRFSWQGVRESIRGGVVHFTIHLWNDELNI